MTPGATREPLPTVLRIISIFCFLIGSFAAAKLAIALNARGRMWLVCSSLLQSLFLWIAAIVLVVKGKGWDPGWPGWPPLVVLVNDVCQRSHDASHRSHFVIVRIIHGHAICQCAKARVPSLRNGKVHLMRQSFVVLLSLTDRIIWADCRVHCHTFADRGGP
jgi:hypothetical protein